MLTGHAVLKRSSTVLESDMLQQSEMRSDTLWNWPHSLLFKHDLHAMKPRPPPPFEIPIAQCKRSACGRSRQLSRAVGAVDSQDAREGVGGGLHQNYTP